MPMSKARSTSGAQAAAGPSRKGLLPNPIADTRMPVAPISLCRSPPAMSRARLDGFSLLLRAELVDLDDRRLDETTLHDAVLRQRVVTAVAHMRLVHAAAATEISRPAVLAHRAVVDHGEQRAA